MAYFRGQGGAIHKMDLPLPETMQDQATKGMLTPIPDGLVEEVQVAEGGVEYTQYRLAGPVQFEPGEIELGQVVQPPSIHALKAEWVGHAVRNHGLTVDDAEALSKQDLIDRYGQR